MKISLRFLGPAAGLGLLFAACTHDYDAYSFGDTGGGSGGKTDGGGATGGSGATGGAGGSGATGGAGGSGGIVVGGGGAPTGGGGAPTGGGGAPIGGGGAGGGCAPTEKTCNGGCVSQGDPAYGCGPTSCDPCQIANATPQCYQGNCALLTCDAGYGDCDQNLGTNGCEQTLDTTAHCGDCGRACSSQNSTGAVCTQGACQHQCEPGFGDCAQPTSGPDDGCEVDLGASQANCGSCGYNCGAQGHAGGFGCFQGGCGCAEASQCSGSGAPGTCDPTSHLCSCESVVCAPGEACSKKQGNSVCSCNGGDTCAAGQTCCVGSAGCTDLQTDDQNCGACAIACPPPQTCSAGQCQ